MPGVDLEKLAATVAANREGIDIFLDVARNIPSDRWTVPVADGAWSPAQLTDHVTRAYDFGTAVVTGTLRGRPLPRLFRWLLGRFWFAPVIRAGHFTGKVKAPKPFLPGTELGDATELLSRLRTASERFATAVDREVSRGAETVLHPMFGTISLLEFLELQVIHVRHHRLQLPTSS